MSIAVVWEFTCDVIGCEEVLTLTGLATLASARREAKDEGWWSNAGGDCRCLTHREPPEVVLPPEPDNSYERMWGRR